MFSILSLQLFMQMGALFVSAERERQLRRLEMWNRVASWVFPKAGEVESWMKKTLETAIKTGIEKEREKGEVVKGLILDIFVADTFEVPRCAVTGWTLTSKGVGADIELDIKWIGHAWNETCTLQLTITGLHFEPGLRATSVSVSAVGCFAVSRWRALAFYLETKTLPKLFKLLPQL